MFGKNNFIGGGLEGIETTQRIIVICDSQGLMEHILLDPCVFCVEYQISK